MTRRLLWGFVLAVCCGCSSMNNTESVRSAAARLAACSGPRRGRFGACRLAGAATAATGALVGGCAGVNEDRREQQAQVQTAVAMAAAQQAQLRAPATRTLCKDPRWCSRGQHHRPYPVLRRRLQSFAGRPPLPQPERRKQRGDDGSAKPPARQPIRLAFMRGRLTSMTPMGRPRFRSAWGSLAIAAGKATHRSSNSGF